jgi:hypothetical protein
MVSRQLIHDLRPEQWSRLEQVGLDYPWDAAWESALAAGAGPEAAEVLAAARRAGAGPRAGAVVAAAVAASELTELSAEDRRRLLLPLQEVIGPPPVPQRQPSRSRRCPALAAVAALVAAGGP